ncbi:MAG TPA: 30S ribosomal protein S20 [Deltaproteobacteria bacterium]|nr:30S ribosomal protein S20 [Deltaproteobacteria bacterium]
MANHPSALKRHRQSQKRRLRNKSYKSAINTSVKKIFASLSEKDTEKAKAYAVQAISRIDKAVTKGILHRNTASRKISRIVKKIGSLTV